MFRAPNERRGIIPDVVFAMAQGGDSVCARGAGRPIAVAANNSKLAWMAKPEAGIQGAIRSKAMLIREDSYPAFESIGLASRPQ
jgi:hypothetical protein